MSENAIHIPNYLSRKDNSMKFKRLAAAACAVFITLTQTAMFSFGVSAEKFSSQSFSLGASTASVLPSESVSEPAKANSDSRVSSNSFTLVHIPSKGGSDTSPVTDGNFEKWSDVLAAISKNSKTDKGAVYTVEVGEDTDIGGAFKMPAAKTFASLRFTGQGSGTLRFTGSITLTGDTVFDNITLESVKNNQPSDFNISAGRNTLSFMNVTGKIKTVSSSATVRLYQTTVGSVSADIVKINGDANVEGNLTAKTALEFTAEDETLNVKGTINTAKLFSDYSGNRIVVCDQDKNKYPLVIGKNGVEVGSDKITLVLSDAAGSVSEMVIGTITGKYSDGLVLNNGKSDFDIVKSNGKLVVVEDSTQLVEVMNNTSGNKSRYLTLDDAVKDISANGTSADSYTIKLNQKIFSDPIAKLPLPTAGKYDTIIFKADSNVTVRTTGDLALTGNVELENITVKKVKVTGKKGSTTETTVPISVNLGKYSLSLISDSALSPDENGTSQIANVSGKGDLALNGVNAAVSGKITVDMLTLADSNVGFEGRSAAFTGAVSVASSDGEKASTFTYDKSIAKNIKLGGVASGQLTVDINELKEGETIASLDKEYLENTVILKDGTLSAVRSGNFLVAEASDNAVKMVESSDGSVRIYSDLASAMTDIARINHKDSEFTVTTADSNLAALPRAGSYAKLIINGKNDETLITLKSGLTLTGNLELGGNVQLIKVNAKQERQPLSINVGKYTLIGNSTELNIASLSGAGTFKTNGTCRITGKVTVGTFDAENNSIIFEGRSAALNSNVNISGNVGFVYDNINTANIKFKELTFADESKLTFKADNIASGMKLASVTGDYIKDNAVIAEHNELSVVRSGSYLAALDNEKAVKTVAWDKPAQQTYEERVYDSFANAANDIARLKNGSASYKIYVNGGEQLVLPRAGTYSSLILAKAENSEASAVVTTKTDLTLTGDLYADDDVVINKVNSSGKTVPISVNLGKNYIFSAKNLSVINGVSQYNNISGNGRFISNGKCIVNGKATINELGADENSDGHIELDSKATFTAKTIDGNVKLIYKAASAAKVKLGTITDGHTVTLLIDDIKDGAKAASLLANDYRQGSVVISGESGEFEAVRSGSFLVAKAVRPDTSRNVRMAVWDSEKQTYSDFRTFDTLADAVNGISDLGNSENIYKLFLKSDAEFVLPSAGTYKTIVFAAEDGVDGSITLKTSNDIVLTGNIEFTDAIAFIKTNGTYIKFTAPTDSDGRSIYTITTGDKTVLGGTLNGEKLNVPGVTPEPKPDTSKNVRTAVWDSEKQTYSDFRTFDTLADAIKGISDLGNSDNIYKVFLKSDAEFVLPSAGTYKTIVFAVEDGVDGSITLKTASDIVLTGDLELTDTIALVNTDGTTIKFTAPTDSDGRSIYTITAGENITLDGTLNGEKLNVPGVTPEPKTDPDPAPEPVKNEAIVRFEMSDDFKVIGYTKDGKTVAFNPSYDIDMNVDGYANYVSLEKDGETYYIPLTSTDNDNSGLTYNGLYISNGRWSDETQSGYPYLLSTANYTRNVVNGWHFSFKMDNRGKRLPADLLNDALHRVNSAFPAANIQVVEAVQKNYIILGEFKDSYVGSCTTENDRVKIELNRPNLESAYGEYNSDTTSLEYKRWLSTVVHELGHTFGNQDQASHDPSLYSYSRNREKALYLQANDIAWLRHAYQDGGADPSIFDTVPDDASTVSETPVSGGEPEVYFDYPEFDSDFEVSEYADNIVTAKLSFAETAVLNIGSEDLPTEIKYNIYDINVIDEEKGTLTNTQLKIPAAVGLDIADGTYKLYLKEYENVPCSLVNIADGIVKVTEVIDNTDEDKPDTSDEEEHDKNDKEEIGKSDEETDKKDEEEPDETDE